jgi:superfamily I DNA and/or RNA helicase
LSARGRLEFAPGLFDIVVFDEASQCDIASALPLLYRAKSVVVIGDAKQLSHISGLARGQDHALMEKHGLFPSFAEWAYAHQSLFALAATQVSSDDIVTLVDHHRSHADIIGFSNAEFYERRLRVATRYDRLKTPSKSEPGVRWIDVPGWSAPQFDRTPGVARRA